MKYNLIAAKFDNFKVFQELVVNHCVTIRLGDPPPYPCTLQVTTLSEYKSTKGRLRKPHKVSKLVQIVSKATKNFVTVGEEIASENPEFQVSELPRNSLIPRPKQPQRRSLAVSRGDTASDLHWGFGGLGTRLAKE